MNLKSILTRPIPNFASARKVKSGYREYPLLVTGEHDNEPLVDIELYGLAGQSYYSRPNNATSDPVPDIDKVVYVRRTIAEKLAAINYELRQSDVITELFGGKVELYIDEGYRSPQMQRKLYEDIFPYLIRQQHPRWSDKKYLPGAMR